MFANVEHDAPETFRDTNLVPLRLYYGQEKNYLTFKKSEKITSAYK
jgi:hypothetical protein